MGNSEVTTLLRKNFPQHAAALEDLFGPMVAWKPDLKSVESGAEQSLFNQRIKDALFWIKETPTILTITPSEMAARIQEEQSAFGFALIVSFEDSLVTSLSEIVGDAMLKIAPDLAAMEAFGASLRALLEPVTNEIGEAISDMLDEIVPDDVDEMTLDAVARTCERSLSAVFAFATVLIIAGD